MSKTLTQSYQLIRQIQMNLTGAYLRVYAKYNSQSVQNNQTSVSVQLRIGCVSGTAFHCYTHSCNFTGGTFGDSDYKGSYYHGWESNTETTILTQTKDITHNTDGSKSFVVGGYFTCSAGVNGTVPDDETVIIPKIDRLSVMTLSSNNFNIGDIITATITQYVSSYHQNLYMVIGGNEVLIQSSATGTQYIETNLLANQIYQQIPNSKYYDSEFRLKTYDSNNNLIGTDTKSFRANVVNSNPLFNIAYEDTNATTTAITQNNQQIIQNNSTLRFKFTNATAQHYATGLVSYSITINGTVKTGSISSSSLNVDWGILNLSDNTNAIVSVTDSRGFTTTKTVALTILEWKLPTAIINLNRQQNYYTQTDIKVDATYSSLDSKNTLTLKYRIKKTTDPDTEWSNYTTIQNNTTDTFNADNQYSWDVQIIVQDSIGTTTYNVVLPIGMAILFIDRLKKSVGINCFPSNNQSLELNGHSIFDLIYPVGSIYTSVNNTNPGTLFGGTWVAFGTGKTLVGVDTNDTDFNTPEKTGGSKDLQQHSHTIDSATLTGSARNFLMDDYNETMVASGIFSLGWGTGTDRTWNGSSGSRSFRELNVNASHSHSMQNAGTGTSGNLQPYITVYMWKRTA